MQFIQLGQQTSIGVRIDAGKAIAGAGDTGSQSPVLDPGFGQPLHLPTKARCSFRVGNTLPVQYNLVSEETKSRRQLTMTIFSTSSIRGE